MANKNLLKHLFKPLTAAGLTAALGFVSYVPGLSSTDIMARIRSGEIQPVERAIRQSINPLSLSGYELVEYFDFDGITEAPDILVVYPVIYQRTTPQGTVEGVVDSIPSECFELNYQLSLAVQNRISCLDGKAVE